MYTSLLVILQKRFENNKHRHISLLWNSVQKHIELFPEKLQILTRMEETGGEPDVVGYDAQMNRYLFMDCSKESPVGRRSLCYDHVALEKRKANRPKSSVMSEAEEIGCTILSEEEYRYLQSLDEFDLKTSSWILTPPALRKRGGALFCDRRYDHVFTYHNGADSYYAARGFRGKIEI